MPRFEIQDTGGDCKHYHQSTPAEMAAIAVSFVLESKQIELRDIEKES
jgi:hypothetical protein